MAIYSLKTGIFPWKILEIGLSEVVRTMDIVGVLLSYIVVGLVAQWFNCEERYIN